MDTVVAEVPKGKKMRKRHIAVAVIAVAIIVFAFIWEAIIGDISTLQRGRTSVVQAEIAGLDWIEARYLPTNPFSRPGTPVTKVNAVVIHYVGNPGTSAEQNRNYFANLAYNGGTNSSSNFIVGLNGEVLQCVPVDEIAYCTPDRNEDTISIECCHPDEGGQFGDETYASVVRLTAYLCRSFNLTADSLLRHYDVTEKICPKYYVENEDAWEQFKIDVAVEIEAGDGAAA